MTWPYADIRTGSLWRAVALQVNSALMQTILGSATRVHVVTDEFNASEGLQDAAWGRVVVVPTQTIWQQNTEVPGGARVTGCLLRTEFNRVEQPGYDVNVALQAAQSEAYKQLQGWVPTVAIPGVSFVLPFYRQTPPQEMPLWDPGRGMWYTSSEYRAEVMRQVGT